MLLLLLLLLMQLPLILLQPVLELILPRRLRLLLSLIILLLLLLQLLPLLLPPPTHPLHGRRQIWILLLFFTLINTHNHIQQKIQISGYIVLVAIVRLGYYYYSLHLLTPITRFNNKFR